MSITEKAPSDPNSTWWPEDYTYQPVPEADDRSPDQKETNYKCDPNLQTIFDKLSEFASSDDITAKKAISDELWKALQTFRQSVLCSNPAEAIQLLSVSESATRKHFTEVNQALTEDELQALQETLANSLFTTTEINEDQALDNAGLFALNGVNFEALYMAFLAECKYLGELTAKIEQLHQETEN